MLNRILIGFILLYTMPSFGLVLDFDVTAPVPSWPDNGGSADGVFMESGFSILGYGYLTPSSIHLDDASVGPWKSKATISSPKRFDALSVNILGYEPSLYYEILDPVTGNEVTILERVAYPNVLVQGIRDSAIVAEARYVDGEFPTYTLSSDFSRLDSLIIHSVHAEDPVLASYFSAFESNLESLYPGMTAVMGYCGNPCSHFDLDSVEVNPTPIPGALILMLSAVLGGGITRRFMSRKSAS